MTTSDKPGPPDFNLIPLAMTLVEKFKNLWEKKCHVVYLSLNSMEVDIDWLHGIERYWHCPKGPGQNHRLNYS